MRANRGALRAAFHGGLVAVLALGACKFWVARSGAEGPETLPNRAETRTFSNTCGSNQLAYPTALPTFAEASRVKELEQKVDALTREVTSLKQQLHSKRASDPSSLLRPFNFDLCKENPFSPEVSQPAPARLPPQPADYEFRDEAFPRLPPGDHYTLQRPADQWPNQGVFDLD